MCCFSREKGDFAQRYKVPCSAIPIILSADKKRNIKGRLRGGELRNTRITWMYLRVIHLFLLTL